MAIPAEKMVWVTANRSFVGGPKIGFTLLEDHCYQIPASLAKQFANESISNKRGWVTLGKERRASKVLK